jgi:hypothetical protein
MPKTMDELNAELKRVFTSDDWLRENKDVILAGLELFEKDLTARLHSLDETSPKADEAFKTISEAMVDMARARKALEAMEWGEK